MIEQIFREYDIRGLFGKELDERSVKAIGLVLGEHIAKFGLKSVSVGYDARLSANELFTWLSSGLNLAGLNVYDIGMAPTPVGYFSVFTYKFDANIMITGSHNPKEYNGFKITIGTDSFFGEDLKALGKKVANLMDCNAEIPTNSACEKYDILSNYIEFFKKEFAHLNGYNLPFVIDCANGAAGITVSKICKELNLNAKILYQNPDGNFPNHHPDPSEEKNLVDLKHQMSENRLNLGFGFDGDADRIAVLTSKRNIKGDELACLLALNMTNPRILGEVKCSQVMYDEIDKIGKSFMGKTGHSNIKKAMKELDIDLAAEVSGHIFFKERYFGFDDAVYAMMRVLELVKLGFDLDAELDKLPKLYSTDEIKIHTSEEMKFKIIAALKREIINGIDGLPPIRDIIDIDGLRVRFDDGWALVRASNTTPVLVTRFEARSNEFLKLLQDRFMKFVDGVEV
ncbi:phosphomannomutase/phosphoglucomutase [Campylobacter geochelonis]|uniref:phosphomannomutase/phosphoglucomutase n=1 Tax=Campylobacter geochelonis TaxID=1780362 RepID=UPI000770B241|nr:phosphomannomutase/phosphoglucomutase [Campylobacter geochelonis]CZE49275.1 phosphomannomutase/phosphoglucomutase (PMM/PGM) [Campylobacter geochelonis]CZE51400.1 phosphomannomutase/phosphoglucomutase (PMM/PGM) [Campylobacter geochelonis]